MIMSPDIHHWLNTLSPSEVWLRLTTEFLTPEMPFEEHFRLFSLCYPEWEKNPESAIIWRPDKDRAAKSALHAVMIDTGNISLHDLHTCSVHAPEIFWPAVLQRLGIRFLEKPQQICDLTKGPEHPIWLPGARFNITDSCFQAPPTAIAVIQKNGERPIEYFSYAALEKEVHHIASALRYVGCGPNDAIALLMPMHFIAVASFLAIIRIGAKVVPVAESFAPDEISRRLGIAAAKIMLTQDNFMRAGKRIPLYKKAVESGAPPAIVLSDDHIILERPADMPWNKFLDVSPDLSPSHPCHSGSHAMILFSSGTTGPPKAIPWTHVTPIKSASDALLHHNLGKGDVINWPTSLGWMMGPWLVFAGLINQGTLALYTDSPHDAKFADFVQQAGVTVQGTVPTLVSHWRKNGSLLQANWQKIRLFTSTGECSNPIDMLYLSSRARYCPILEYCGGTEIGGAYITSTLLEDNCPSVLTTPAMGSDFILIDEEGHATDQGEVALRVPALGLSLELTNADHHTVYFADMPADENENPLRRHGDCIQQLPGGNYRMLGRNDDTMKLGGIKISSAEIERALAHSSLIIESAAIARQDKSGPARLIIHAVPRQSIDPEILRIALQNEINLHLNPLFHIDQVILTNSLPRTISGKIMRRMLRQTP